MSLHKTREMEACSTYTNKPTSNSHCCSHTGVVLSEGENRGVDIPSQEGEQQPAVRFEDTNRAMINVGEMWFLKTKDTAVCPLHPPTHPRCLVPNLEECLAECRGCHEWSVSPVDKEKKTGVLTMPNPGWKKPNCLPLRPSKGN